MSSAPYTLAGVLGWPVRHSRSPLMHNHWIADYGLQGAYVLLQAAPATLGDALRGLPALGFAGCNLTIPHKVAAMPLVDEVDAMARRMGAINTVVVRPDGSLRGFNTDGYGYLQSLVSQCPSWRADAGPAVVLGAGGGARAVVVALAEQGVREIRVCNRSPDKAEALARAFGAPVVAVPWAQREDALADAGLLVNTTSLGMVGQAPLELSLARLPAHAVVSDLVYSPLDTPLLQAARARGHAVADGLGMLMHQARPAFEAWFGVLPEITPALRARLEASL